MPTSLQSLASPTAAASTAAPTETLLQSIYAFIFGTSTLPTSLGAFITSYSPYASFFYNTEGLPYFSVGMGNFGVQMAKSLGMLGGAPAAAGAGAATGGLGGLGGMLGGGGGGAAAGGAGVAAGLGNAGSVGKLAVPPSWIGGAPLAAPHAPLPMSSVSAAPEGAGGSGNLLGGMPLAGGGGGFGGPGAGPRYGFKPTVMSRPPFAG
jgi:PPE-repeat protein